MKQIGKYEYIISPRVQKAISTFYYHVALKYVNTFSLENMVKKSDEAYNSIYQIENGLLRRNPTIKQWQGKGYMVNTKKWYYLYRIEGNTIVVIDARYCTNMHENVERLKKIIQGIVRKTLRNL